MLSAKNDYVVYMYIWTDHTTCIMYSVLFYLQLAQVLERDRKSCKAMLQLLSNRDKVLQVDYDSICEYVGDINEEFDYQTPACDLNVILTL